MNAFEIEENYHLKRKLFSAPTLYVLRLGIYRV